MDAKSRKRRRESSISLREQRWSMSSQRLEQIVAALMKPVSHYWQSFDRDDSGLLEEYLTAAGLRALEALEAGHEPPPPNYAEMGLVIQSFANNYSRKVDHLSRLVNSFSHTLEADIAPSPPRSTPGSPDAEPTSPAPGARPRRRSASADEDAGAAFASIPLRASAGARRSAAPAGPPPTLPRGYAEQQPRAPAPERALHDYDGEPIGSLDDFRVAWRLHDGFLVEELESGAGGDSELRPLSLMELQEACARAAAPAPAPPPSPPASPAPPPSPPAAASTPPAVLAPPAAALRRKRRGEMRVEDLLTGGSFNMDITASLRKRLTQRQEFSVEKCWIQRVVRHRRDVILQERRALESPPREFRGFDTSWVDIGGFLGWGRCERAEAQATAQRAGAARDELEGDDDRFFESGSSLSADRFNQETETAQCAAGAATAALDLPALARDVRRALPPAPHALAWSDLAAATARAQPQPARVLLDILMKATRGEVEIERGEPLSIGAFSVRVLTEERPLALDDEDLLGLAGAPRPRSPPSPEER